MDSGDAFFLLVFFIELPLLQRRPPQSYQVIVFPRTVLPDFEDQRDQVALRPSDGAVLLRVVVALKISCASSKPIARFGFLFSVSLFALLNLNRTIE
jgi:hypothetical protein